VKLLVMLQEMGKTVREQDKRAIAISKGIREQDNRRGREQDNRRAMPWEIAWFHAKVTPT
jgi:hypothetical protein